MKKYFKKFWYLVLLAGLLLAFLVYQIPSLHSRLSWRLDNAWIYIQSVFSPVEAAPLPSVTEAAALPATTTPTRIPSPTATVQVSPTPLPTATPIPGQVQLPAPALEYEDVNNCGPATLAMALRFYGWEGDQHTINEVIKTQAGDKNVNVDELVYYALNNAGWLKTEYRVGGNIDLLRQLIAAGIPVTIEEAFATDKQYWVGDDQWAGHYILLTGYDDAARTFITQDSQLGADRNVAYEKLDADWQAFNRVFVLIYRPDQQPIVQGILGADWDVDANRANAMEAAQKETETDPNNAFAWFNLGTNLVYFDRYAEAAQAFDKAREIGLPQRMLRYQFGPFIAYFQLNRNEDLLALTEYALQITSVSEEALMWRAWALYRAGDSAAAIDALNKALEIHPGYSDAEYALQFIQNN